MSCLQSPMYTSSVECYIDLCTSAAHFENEISTSKYLVGWKISISFENLRIHELMSPQFKNVVSS